MGRGGRRQFAIGAGILLVVYVVLAVVLWQGKDFDGEGVLSRTAPALDAPLTEDTTLEDVAARCFAEEPGPDDVVKVVGGQVRGAPYYACYWETSGEFLIAEDVLDSRGVPVTDVGVIKEGGAWPWIGVVKSLEELVLGAVAVLVYVFVPFVYYGRSRPSPSWRDRTWLTSTPVLFLLGAIPLVGWLVLANLGGLSRPRRSRVALQVVIGWLTAILMFIAAMAISVRDPWGITVTLLVLVAFLYGVAAGQQWVAPATFGLPEDLPATLPPSTDQQQRLPFAAPPPSPPPAPPRVSSTGGFRVQRPGELPTFATVGGMEELKREFSETFGLLLPFAAEAEDYRITWNGLLLHGPPGSGKTLIAKAAAGEFGLSFLHVSTGDLVSPLRGDSARRVKAAFAAAAVNVPCVLFLDELDSIAQRRADTVDAESRRTLNQLLQSLDEYRVLPELIVVAATNTLDDLDEAVIRDGRFDKRIRVDLPDRPTRKAVFAAQLSDRPTVDDLDLDMLAAKSEGLTPAAIAHIVEAAALNAFREAAASGELVHMTMSHLEHALRSRGGQDRPTVEEWTWDRLVLPQDTLRELQQLQALIEDPERARSFGVEPPSGVLLTGPPGTGKTSVAKVLAAQARCSFYLVSSADVTSKWLGEAERAIARLFRRARDNRPSIVFLDEIDAIAGRRGEYGTYDRQVNELLEEMDGLGGRSGVLVVAATNRPDQLDPALLRGGRLSRQIEIGLPDLDCRRRLLELGTARMPLVGVDLGDFARRTEGLSGADLVEGLCQDAARRAHRRAGGETGVRAAVFVDDFEEALAHLPGREPSPPPRRRLGHRVRARTGPDE